MPDQFLQKKSDGRDLGQRIAAITYRMLKWGRDHLPRGVRSLIGILLMICGIFGFLPILGFWMFPLGIAFIALDIPPMNARIDGWLQTLHSKTRDED